jgi:hypothetical protein
MKPDAAALLESYDAFKQASGQEADHLWGIYQARLDDVLARQPNLSRETLQRIVDVAYQHWLKAQNKPTSLPPKA